ncbi:unnamed protein product [Clonostachys rhizophaga]|uniref:Uncharacterized protein n=1 Tax=Clonostachys rhizophaga TaxID=160324 RepID=A0A9N9VVG0_9HYPO|nr:unnamed protein product [Clonostachys rhizophaga]
MSRRGRNQWGRRGNGPQRNENSFGPGPIAARKPQSDEIEIYGIVQSTQRLEKFGFRPEVTSLSTSEYYKAWEKMAVARSSKPSRADLYDVADGIQGALGLRFRESTLATLVFNPSSHMGRRYIKTAVKGGDQTGLLGLLYTGGIGSTLGEQIFASGLKTVQSLALASLKAWDAIVNASNIWNFLSRDFHSQGHNGVFLVVTPEYAVGDFLRARDLDPLSLNPTNPVRGWFDKVIDEELEIFTTINKVHDLVEKNQLDHALIASMSPSTVTVISELSTTKDIWRHRQFVWTDPRAMFEPQHRMLGNCLKTMIRKLYQHRQGVKVLHFEKTPLLDRRVLAIILRGLPKVTMIGVYDCPLIHFGDVICILDLIHEINLSRRENGLPLIDSFDFRPHYEKGMPFNEANSACYGLTWDPLRLEVVQRGFYNIILKAFLKSRAMNLKLLFDRDSPFRDFLFQVPNLPFGVPCFLDALYRYVDIQGDSLRAQRERRRALFDLLKPIRLHLDDAFDKDWPSWYLNEMGENLITCASCGYETLGEFYPVDIRNAGPDHTICAGCTLQRWFDKQAHHLRLVKLDNLKVLFTAWEAYDFNLYAPVEASASGILNLKVERITKPGDTAQLHHKQNKMHFDSLQNLPSLEKLGDLSGDSELIWRKFMFECEQTDLFCRVVRLLCAKKKPGKGDKFLTSFAPSHTPDHVDEMQKARLRTYERQSHDFKTVMDAHVGHVEKRWAPGAPKGLKPTSLPGFW